MHSADTDDRHNLDEFVSPKHPGSEIVDLGHIGVNPFVGESQESSIIGTNSGGVISMMEHHSPNQQESEMIQ
jgi:hypothetical protein